MIDLIVKLHAAIDEDERIALAASTPPWSQWSGMSDEDFAHADRNDPDATKRRVAAYRKILKLHCTAAEYYPEYTDKWAARDECMGCGLDVYGEDVTPDIRECPIVLILTEVYGIEP